MPVKLAQRESRAALALADNVRRFKAARELSQKEIERLSSKTGGPHVSSSTIGYVLNYRDASDRHAAIDTVEGLARVFAVEPHQLLIPGFAEQALTLDRNVVPLPSPRHSAARSTVQPTSSAVSQHLRLDALRIAIELAEEALRGKTLSPGKRAELVALIYEGLVDGLPEAKILRLARTAVKQ